MHKSSSLTFVFKYLFPVFMIGGAVMGVLVAWTQGTAESQAFAKSFGIAAIWISFFLVQMPFRLKNIVADETGVLVKEHGKQSLIAYRDIKWVAKFDITAPWFITLKYHDRATGSDRKIAYMPKQQGYGFGYKDELTEYIRSQIRTHQPGYSKDMEPTMTINFLKLMLISLPFWFLMLYFLKDSFFHF